jgi:predicted nucleotide-binding protein
VVAGTEQQYQQAMLPSGQIMSRDMEALTEGLFVAPHQAVQAEVLGLQAPFEACRQLAAIAGQAAAHLKRLAPARRALAAVQGERIFIGHGRSHLWRELKDFVQDRLGLEWDEFNRVPVAGVTNITRLSEMLDAAGIAFLVLTAEDEQSDGSANARQNVVHEAGLFQGRLGFTRAIVLLEEGCAEFSNIQGLGQIRFPEGRIDAAFEEVRRVVEREELLSSSSNAP